MWRLNSIFYGLSAAIWFAFVPLVALGEATPDPAPLTADDLIPRRSINVSRMGLNAFANDPRFGTVRAQLREVKHKLGIRFIRVLFAWNDQVQSSPGGPIDFSFYDDIARNIPKDTQALVILTGLPSWMANSNNWISGNPRLTFVERWVKPVASRYASNSRIKAVQIWNESNNGGNPDNETLGMVDIPENYLEMLALAQNAVKTIAPNKKVVNAATTAINQDFPETPDYNQALLDGGIESLVDIFAAHYYGNNVLNVIRPGGSADILNQVEKPIWITESGAKGISKQRAYVERYWPFLSGMVPGVKRYYYYQFTEDAPAGETYGLRNPDPNNARSDLYRFLRNRVLSRK